MQTNRRVVRCDGALISPSPDCVRGPQRFRSIRPEYAFRKGGGMAQSALERFPWRPFAPGAPGPEIFEILRDLDIKVQLQAVSVMIRTDMAMTKARLDGLAQ